MLNQILWNSTSKQTWITSHLQCGSACNKY